MKHCPNCNTELDDNSRYCTECGANVCNVTLENSINEDAKQNTNNENVSTDAYYVNNADKNTSTEFNSVNNFNDNVNSGISTVNNPENANNHNNEVDTFFCVNNAINGNETQNNYQNGANRTGSYNPQPNQYRQNTYNGNKINSDTPFLMSLRKFYLSPLVLAIAILGIVCTSFNLIAGGGINIGVILCFSCIFTLRAAAKNHDGLYKGLGALRAIPIIEFVAEGLIAFCIIIISMLCFAMPVEGNSLAGTFIIILGIVFLAPAFVISLIRYKAITNFQNSMSMNKPTTKLLTACAVFDFIEGGLAAISAISIIITAAVSGNIVFKDFIEAIINEIGLNESQININQIMASYSLFSLFGGVSTLAYSAYKILMGIGIINLKRINENAKNA